MPFQDRARMVINSLALHDPLPIYEGQGNSFTVTADGVPAPTFSVVSGSLPDGVSLSAAGVLSGTPVNVQQGSYSFTIEADRSEEHTSELQSRENLVCRLLLEKKKA